MRWARSSPLQLPTEAKSTAILNRRVPIRLLERFDWTDPCASAHSMYSVCTEEYEHSTERWMDYSTEMRAVYSVGRHSHSMFRDISSSKPRPRVPGVYEVHGSRNPDACEGPPWVPASHSELVSVLVDCPSRMPLEKKTPSMPRVYSSEYVVNATSAGVQRVLVMPRLSRLRFTDICDSSGAQLEIPDEMTVGCHVRCGDTHQPFACLALGHSYSLKMVSQTKVGWCRVPSWSWHVDAPKTPSPQRVTVESVLHHN